MERAARLKTHLPEDCGLWLDDFAGDVARAWRECGNAEWLLVMSLAVDVDRHLVVQAALDIASAAVDHRAPGNEIATRALRLARAWIDGRATSSEAWACGFSTMEAADHAQEDAPLAAAIRAAAFVAFACDDLADATFYLHRSYASKAAEQARIALDGTEHSTPEKWAAHVRARIPLTAFVSAFAVASEPPPPQPDVEEEPPSDGFYT